MPQRLLHTSWFGKNGFSLIPVSLDVCPGTIPNGKLSADCIRDPNMGSCYVTCKDGYRQVTRRRLVYCHEGRWANYNNNYGDGFRDICLAEGLYLCLGNFACFFVVFRFFLQNQLFRKTLSGIPSGSNSLGRE